LSGSKTLGDMYTCRPFLGFVGPISLSSILEPIANLCGRQSSDLGKRSLLTRRRIRIARVTIFEDRPRLLLEAVRRLLAVPDGRW